MSCAFFCNYSPDFFDCCGDSLAKLDLFAPPLYCHPPVGGGRLFLVSTLNFGEETKSLALRKLTFIADAYLGNLCGVFGEYR